MGQMTRRELQEVSGATESPSISLFDLDAALTRLEQQWQEKAELVKLRYFAGLTIPEASRAMKISTATAERHWRFARAWLYSQLRKGE
jgi:DNA-directed RNA polymerase specialized sigma24 family protein